MSSPLCTVLLVLFGLTALGLGLMLLAVNLLLDDLFGSRNKRG